MSDKKPRRPIVTPVMVEAAVRFLTRCDLENEPYEAIAIGVLEAALSSEDDRLAKK